MSELTCGCTPDASGFGYCGECTRKLHEKIWKEMSEKDRDYDRQFDPRQSKALDDSLEQEDEEEGREYNTGCSCHINPPCSYCTSQSEDAEE